MRGLRTAEALYC